MADNLDIKTTYDAFSKIVIQKWRTRMLGAGVGIHSGYTTTRRLYNSFRFYIDPGRIDFTFLQYGHYVDRGVGREVRRGNSGDLGFTPKRKPKKWYYAVFMSQARALERIISEKFGVAASIYIRENWESPEFTMEGRQYDANGNRLGGNPLFEQRRQEFMKINNWVK